MRVYVLCDLEGAAGVVDFETQTRAGTVYYEQARRLATEEVNALVDGLLEGGATDIVVLDGHGPGGIDIELLHPEARAIIGRPLPPGWGFDDGYDALILYGHHAMNHVENAVLCHSWSSTGIHECRLNGEPIGEIGFNIGLAGHYGIPTILISGDRAAIEEARHYVPAIEGVVVKEGMGRTSALTLSPRKARQLLREAARRALDRIDEIEPYRFEPPYRFRTSYTDPRTASARARQPGVTLIDPWTVEVGTDHYPELCRIR